MRVWKLTFVILCCLLTVSSLPEGDPPSTTSPPPSTTTAQNNISTSTTCPTCNAIPYNITADQAVSNIVRLIPNIWNQRVWSGDAAGFLSTIKKLVKGTIPSSIPLAVYTTRCIHNYLPYLDQRPDACAIAAVINASYSCSVDHNQTLMQNALDQWKDSFLNDINPRLERTMAYRSGCDVRCGEYPPDQAVNKSVCHKDGFVYPMREIWDDLFRGIPISISFRIYVNLMYNSYSYIDRFVAACATLALFEAPRKVFDSWDQNIIAEGLDLALSSPIQKKCCYHRITRAEEIREIYDADAVRSIDAVKQHYATTQCV